MIKPRARQSAADWPGRLITALFLCVMLALKVDTPAVQNIQVADALN